MQTRRQSLERGARLIGAVLMTAWAGPLLAVVDKLAAADLPGSVRRVVFLGDSITYAGQYTAYVEAYFVLREPRRRMEWINVGLPSETTSGLSEPGHKRPGMAHGLPLPDAEAKAAEIQGQIDRLTKHT